MIPCQQYCPRVDSSKFTRVFVTPQFAEPLLPLIIEPTPGGLGRRRTWVEVNWHWETGFSHLIMETPNPFYSCLVSASESYHY